MSREGIGERTRLLELIRRGLRSISRGILSRLDQARAVLLGRVGIRASRVRDLLASGLGVIYKEHC
jgi:hypothetical protein